MTSTLHPYPAYKDSGVPWLGKVPAHWDVKRLGAVLKEREETNQNGQVSQVLSVLRDIGVIPYEQKGNVGNKRSEDITRYKIVRPNDIVVNCMNVIIGSVGLSRYTGCLSPVYYVLHTRSDNNLPEYVNYIFKMKPFQRSLVRLGNGILAHRMRIAMEKLKCELLPLPPLTEQRAIARFLAHHERLTRRYIRAQQRLIALLQEEKQALIQQAVTRGLDPDVPLKDSGVPWLGKIPVHWEVRRFKFLMNIRNGQIDPRENRYKHMILIAPNHIEKGTGQTIFLETADEQGADSGKYLVREGELIYSKIRPNLRKVTIAQTDCLCSADMYPIQPDNSELHTQYALLLMLSQPFTKYVVDCSLRVAMPKVNREALGECWLWYPNLNEQSRIMTWIDNTLLPIDKEIMLIKRQIKLVKEYRTRLIADVVTGKLDVRGADIPEDAGDDLEDEDILEEEVLFDDDDAPPMDEEET